MPDLPEPLPLLPDFPLDEPHESEDDDDQPLHPSNLLPLLPDLPEDEDDHDPDEHGLPRSRVWIEMYEMRKV